MGDDLENNWGVDHVLCRPSQHFQNCPENSDFEGLRMRVSRGTARNFQLEKVVACGSDANLWAISDATGFDTTCCLFGAGSYIAGDGGVLQEFSSSLVKVKESCCCVAPPHQVQSDLAQKNTVALPYHIPGVLSDYELTKYENICFDALNVVIKKRVVEQTPCKALFLELVLASNGALLSGRALECIGSLLLDHNMTVIIDEVMTSVWTTSQSILLCMTKPVPFLSIISHVTLGKWVSVGLVLVSQSFFAHRNDGKCASKVMKKRSESTVLHLEEAAFNWDTVMQQLSHGAIEI